MPNAVYIGFDFGFKRIGVAVGQRLSLTASPLPTLFAKQGVPDWIHIQKMIQEWKPKAFIVGLPTCIDSSELYTTKAARRFAEQLRKKYSLPVHLVDERLSTVEAKDLLFRDGGYRKLKNTEVDSIAACVILEQWLQHPE